MDRFEVKGKWTSDEAGVVEGWASIFGNVDLGGDVVHKGAFASAAAPLPMLASHDQADVVGVWDVITETDTGLYVKGRLLVGEVKRAAEVRALIREGAMGGLSIGYVAKEAKSRRGGGRDLMNVNLLEVSIVAVPMNPAAKITRAKSADADGKETMDPEELKKLQEATADLAKKQVAIEAKNADLEAKNAAMVDVIAALQRGGTEKKAKTSAEVKGWAPYLQRGDRALSEDERKAFVLSSDPQGGFLAPPEFASEIIRDLIEYSPIRSLAKVRGVNGPSLIFLTRGLLSGATWHGEPVTVSETTGAPFGQREIPVKMLSTFIEVSNWNLTEAAQAVDEIRLAMAEDFAKKEATAFVNGSGNYDPSGIMSNAEIAYSPSLDANLITVDGLIKFLYAVPMTYRNGGAFIMNGKTLAAIRTLADTTGQKFWQPSLQVGQPETLLGRPVVECIDMPDVAANAFPILYGDFSGYQIIDHTAMSVLVDPYSQATLQRTRYHATRRVGADVLQPFKFRKFKIAVS